MRIHSARPHGESDCVLTIEVDGQRHELIARRVYRDERVGMVVGAFEPTATFHSLGMSVDQVRALVRAAVQAHLGEPLALPMDVPA